jgi:cephalosporin hydroxylase
VLVILDSDHRENHVSRELELYSELVKPGGYLIVQDTNINGHPVLPRYGPGPMEAVQKFLADKGKSFQVDKTRERLLFTMHPSGYLQRRAN